MMGAINVILWISLHVPITMTFGISGLKADSLNILYCPKTWQYDQIQVFQLRTSSPLYKQYTNTVEHKYTKATVFLNN